MQLSSANVRAFYVESGTRVLAIFILFLRRITLGEVCRGFNDGGGAAPSSSCSYRKLPSFEYTA